MADPTTPEPGPETSRAQGPGAPAVKNLSDNETAELLRDSAARLKDELGKVVVGQHEVIEQMLIAMFAGQMVTAAAYNAVDQRRRIAHGDGGMPTKAKKSACLQALRRFCSCAFRIEREA